MHYTMRMKSNMFSTDATAKPHYVTKNISFQYNKTIIQENWVICKLIIAILAQHTLLDKNWYTTLFYGIISYISVQVARYLTSGQEPAKQKPNLKDGFWVRRKFGKYVLLLDNSVCSTAVCFYVLCHVFEVGFSKDLADDYMSYFSWFHQLIFLQMLIYN